MIRNPTAGIVIYNYRDRGGASGISSQETNKIYLTKSIVSISTSKSKSGPSGRFEISLAPTKNWISEISIGSWIEIHMSSRVITQSDLDGSSIETLKLIGMIDSVRMSVSVDQNTGARNTTYSIVGRDWGSALESCVYVDAAVTNRTDTALQAAFRLNFDQLFDSIAKDPFTSRFSTLNLVLKILNYWGVSSAASKYGTVEETSGKTGGSQKIDMSRFAPISEFILPKDLFNKVSQGPRQNNKKSQSSRQNLASCIKVVAGKLSGYNRYSANEIESVGYIDPARLIGTNSVWNLLTVHSNDIVNELVADLRWEDEKSKPQFTVYKRIKPFWLPKQANSDGAGDPKIQSNFFNLRKINITKDQTLAIETGDNAEDIINFIEIAPQMPSGTIPDNNNALLADVKPKSAVHDVRSFARHGIKPMFYSSIFFPPDSKGAPMYAALTNWLPVMRGWFFDCHKMLNGTVTIVGQNNYIGVGDNILMDSEIFGDLSYVKEEVGKKPSDIKILAHVQSISHRFSYIENGSRSFITTINFVRGIMTDAKGNNLLGSKSFGIATQSSDVKDKDRTNISYKDEATK